MVMGYRTAPLAGLHVLGSRFSRPGATATPMCCRRSTAAIVRRVRNRNGQKMAENRGDPRGELDRGDARDVGSRARGRGTPGVEDAINGWAPLTKLGRLVKRGDIKTLEEIRAHSMPIKECEIVDFLVGTTLREEVLKVMPIRIQTCAGQRTRYKAIVAISDSNGHLGLGIKCSKNVTTAIRGATVCAKLAVVPVRRGYWGKHVGKPHTVPCEVTGKCGTVCVRLIPAPRGTGIVSAQMAKKLLTMAGIEDCYTTATTGTVVNFAMAAYSAIARTYSFI